MKEKAYWIGLNRVSGIGSMRMRALLDAFGSAQAAWQASIQELRDTGLDRRSIENLVESRRTVDLSAEWARIQRAGVDVLTWADDDYPENMRPIDGAPPVLYVQGRLEALDRWSVAVVGTRRASAYGREIAHKLARDLARHGVTVVSGLALGVDAVAHRAALEAGGRTIAVLGSGVDQIYPAQNRDIVKQLLANDAGAVVSEYPLGTKPEARNFPPRNRIISALSRAVIVIEAGKRSGALITASMAAEQGRDVFAVPGSILHPGSVGCNQLIQKGATPLLSIDDVLEELSLSNLHEKRAAHETVPPDPLEARLLEQLSAEPRHVDDLVRQSAFTTAQISSLLTIMELKGLVRQVGAMLYVRN